MASDTEANALADLVLLVGETLDRAVQDVDPANVEDGTITCVPTNGTPTEFNFRVTLYKRGDFDGSQRALRDQRQEIEDALRSTSQFGPSNWEYDYLEQTDAWLCRFNINAGREDF